MAEHAEHALVVYRAGGRADAALHSLRTRTARLTVVVLAREETQRQACCDTRSVLWKRLCRELACEDLSRAAEVLDDHEGVDLQVLVAPASDASAAIAGQALSCGADEIVLADPHRSGLRRLERRRLRRCSDVPVRW